MALATANVYSGMQSMKRLSQLILVLLFASPELSYAQMLLDWRLGVNAQPVVDPNSNLKRATAFLYARRIQEGEEVYSKFLGTLINPQWVLTSASATENMVFGQARINGKIYTIGGVFRFRAFPVEARHDFALIKLTVPVEDEIEIPILRILEPEDVGNDTYLTFRPRVFIPEDVLANKIHVLWTQTHEPSLELLVRENGLSGCGLTMSSNVPCWSYQQYQAGEGSEGAGLFDGFAQKHLVGVLSRTVRASPIFEQAIPGNLQITAYSLIDEDVLAWIHRTIEADIHGPAVLAFLMCANRPGPLQMLVRDVRRLIIGHVAPSLYTNVNGWMQRARERGERRRQDPSHGQNVRALLANPMVDGDNADLIATLLDNDLNLIDAASPRL
jgi:hypothetical protein